MVAPENREIEVNIKEGIPVMSFNPKPKGQKICTFLIDVQVIEVTVSGIRLQEMVGGVVGRVHTFRPNQKQLDLMTPYLWTYLKMEVSILLPDTEGNA